VGRVGLLHQQREVQAGRAATDAGDTHGQAPSFCITLEINSSNVKYFGTDCRAGNNGWAIAQ
jgi:hypothetical protein